MNNILSNLGLCRKAGFLINGFDAVIKEALDASSKLAGILVSCDISDKTLKELKFKSKNAEIIKLSVTKDDIGRVMGKNIAVIGITDEGFYKKFKAYL
ncbi:MAG: 50S ribosomal protein L7 [Eubacterium sp.]|jgi:ribosomal protein L7Ae-like RNA K-turn-binding protein|nr:50S ribosomal protein L7 [Eubacterium sp.]